VISASLLLIPTILALIILEPGVSYSTLLIVASIAGVGGGNFASSMTNINAFYPEGKKGWALGLNAGGGNLGVAAVQLLALLVLATAGASHPRVLIGIYIPLIVIAALGAYLFMDNLTTAKNDKRAMRDATRDSYTWIVSFLYIGTFGSFIGYSFALPLVIKNTFPEFLAHHPFIATYLAGLGFLGALIGSVARPLGGWLADRFGGARITLMTFLLMGAFTLGAIAGINRHSFTLCFGSFMVIFLLAGMGNGSTYRMIPSIFAALGRKEASEKGLDPKQSLLDFKRQAAAVIGITGAVGAFGGFLVQVALRQSSLGVSALIKAAKTPADKIAIAQAHANWSVGALWVFVGCYAAFAGLTWFFYMRRSFATEKVASLAYASV
jgi:NNP family nitrate/nitrite transporter-like MFS transporter